MFAIIERDEWVRGSGVSYTEDFETVKNVPETYTATDFVKCLDEVGEEGYKAYTENVDIDNYSIFRCHLYADGADPMFDEPVSVTEEWAYFAADAEDD